MKGSNLHDYISDSLQNLRLRGEELEAMNQAQHERFEADFARIYASEKSASEPVKDYASIRGE